MKLLYCPSCHDIFNLSQTRIKSCHCGETKGVYINQSNAEVNGGGYSLAMGSGSIIKAINNINTVDEDWRQQPGDIWRRHPTSIICWARQHDGPTNSHTKVVKALK